MMSKERYNQAFGNIKSTENFEERIAERLNSPPPEANRKIRPFTPAFAGLFLCIAFSIVGYIYFSQVSDSEILKAQDSELSQTTEKEGLPVRDKKTSEGVNITDIDNAPSVSVQNDLVYLTEEKIFGLNGGVSVISGEVTDIRNIKVDFGGENECYWSVISVKANKCYRGDINEDEIIEIRVNCPIYGDVWVEDTGVISNVQVGMQGIFMPTKYTGDDIYQVNDLTLLLSDICDYGLPDGERFAFLEKDGEIIYADWAFPSFNGVESLDDAAERILEFINNPQVTLLGFQTKFVRALGTDQEEDYPRTTVISSREELMRYYEENEDCFQFESNCEETESFQNIVGGYTDDFFKEKSLVIAVLSEKENSVSLRFAVDSVNENGEIRILRLEPDTDTEDTTELHIFIELENHTMAEDFSVILETD